LFFVKSFIMCLLSFKKRIFKVSLKISQVSSCAYLILSIFCIYELVPVWVYSF